MVTLYFHPKSNLHKVSETLWSLQLNNVVILAMYRVSEIMGAGESSRFMGRVILDRPKSTTFAFNSALPKGQGWEWTIVADAAA